MAVTRRLRKYMRAIGPRWQHPHGESHQTLKEGKSCRNEVARSQVQAGAVPTGVAQVMPERVPRAAPETARKTSREEKSTSGPKK